MNDDIARSAMRIILHAGDARDLIRQALTAIEDEEFAEAESRLVAAKQKLGEAHRAQTETIQGEARGIQQEYSVLFTHAQDTLMTVMSEHGLAQHLVRLFKKVSERIDSTEVNAS